MLKSIPRDYQLEASVESLKMKRKILCLDTGSGKTLVGLHMMEELRNTWGVNDLVVTAPKTAMATWQTEIPKHSDLTASFNEYNPRVDIKVLQENRMLKLLPEQRPSPSAFFIDECHFLCSETSLKAAQFRGGTATPGGREVICDNTFNKFDYVFGLTASPMMNHIEDLYYLVNSFFPGYFGYLQGFLELYTIGDVRDVGWTKKRVREVVGFQNLDHLNMMLKPVMYRHVMAYPLKFYFKYIDCPVNEWPLYLKAARGQLHEQARNFAGRLPDLQRVANGSAADDGGYRRDHNLSAKENLLVDGLNYILDHKHGAVVFTTALDTHKRMQDRIAQHVRAEKCWYMKGTTSEAERAHIAKNFGPNDVLFATMVGGVSLNLQSVNNVIFYDIPWSVGKVMQCLGRVTRMDSTFDAMHVIFLGMKATIDEYKLAMVSGNLHVLRAILSGFGFVDMYFDNIRKRAVEHMRRTLLWVR